MMPETWLPTWTVVTAESVPVALTVMVTLPLADRLGAVLSPPLSLPRRRKNRPTSTPTTTTMAMMR